MSEPIYEPTDGNEFELVVPFIACASQGSPYDDDAFVAGFQCGAIDKALTVAKQAGAARVCFTVRTTLVGQLELIGMNRGYGRTSTAQPWDDDHAGPVDDHW